MEKQVIYIAKASTKLSSGKKGKVFDEMSTDNIETATKKVLEYVCRYGRSAFYTIDIEFIEKKD